MAHRQSHRDLLRWSGPGPGRELDAIIVPATRPARHLASALELGAALGCQVVILCSGERAVATEIANYAEGIPDVRAAVVDLPSGYDNDLLRFETSFFAEAAANRLGDLSLKRNIGLLLARLAGWGSILFLDDDMRDIKPDLVRRAASSLARYSAVGMLAQSFPDNSVVCHANRFGDGDQDVFVSGSALVVDTRHIRTFFPRIYNEDWLFLFDWLALRRVGVVGQVRQLTYEPFANPRRAIDEEFGEVLAEGLVALLHERRSLADADPAYWRCFLNQRRDFIARAAERISRQVDPRAGTDLALKALAAAEERRAKISQHELANYVEAWQEDLANWRREIADLPQQGSLGKALGLLGLAGTTHLVPDYLPGDLRRAPAPRRIPESTGTRVVHKVHKVASPRC